MPKVIPYADEIFEDRQCGFHHNKLMTDQIRAGSLKTVAKYLK
jgi:hypothetical protein